MNTHVKQFIVEQAVASPDQEVCGLIVYGKNLARALPSQNASREDHAHSFLIAKEDYIAATKVGRVCGVYHSHPSGSAAFSEDDISSANALALPSYIVSLDKDGGHQWLSYVPKTYYVNPLGAQFSWGLSDCLEVVRTYYRQELNIYLSDYDRDESFRDTQSSAIIDHIEAEGFRNVGTNSSAATIHDVLLFNTDGRKYPHHLGVCIGKSRLLHHPYGLMSRVDDIDGHWLDKLIGILRHRTLYR